MFSFAKSTAKNKAVHRYGFILRDKTNPFVAIGWNVLRNTVNIPPPNRISRAGTPVMQYSGYVCWENSWTCSSVLSSNERKIIYWLVPTVKGEYS